MRITVADIIAMMEEIAPTRLAENWDNPGLQVGDHRWEVKKILISLDPTPEVMNYAIKASVDMLITHHPLLFRPLKSIDLATPIGGILAAAIQNDIAVYAAHTNFDSAAEGLNDMLAGRLGLKNIVVLSPSENLEAGDIEDIQKYGLGRIGDLPGATELISLAQTLKSLLNIESVRLVGDPKRRVSRIALCTGSGASLLDRFFSSGADVFITGDIRYHDARDAEERQVSLIDIGHFGSEHIMVSQLENRLSGMIAMRQSNVEVLACDVEKDPFLVV